MQCCGGVSGGAAYTHLVALLLRFYLPEAGTILLDGVDIAALPVAWLRSQIGFVWSMI